MVDLHSIFRIRENGFLINSLFQGSTLNLLKYYIIDGRC